MMGVTLRGIAGRKIRSLLTAFAVVLGIAMVSGTYVLTDTFQKAFDKIFTESYVGTDAVVSGKQLLEFSTSGRAPVPESVLDEIRALPEVEAAAGGIFDLQSNSNPAQMVDADGKKIGGSGGAPTFGVGLDVSELQFSPLSLTEGKWAVGPDQVVIDANTAGNEGYAVGDTIGVAALGPVQQYEITGIAKFGSVDSIGGATFAVFDVPTAQALFQKQGHFDSIAVGAKEGTTPEQLVEKLEPLVPATAEVQTGAAQAAADAAETNEGIKFITYMLLGFGGVALFVGAFVIFNTLSITVAQRTREFATLRTLGGSRKQVLGSVVIEGFVIGLLASIVGLFLGLAVGKGMNSLFVALGVDLPQAGTVFATRTIVVSLIVGTTVTVVASIVPALRATRVPPISAVREGSTPPTSRFAPYAPYVALTTIALAIVSLGVGLFVSATRVQPLAAMREEAAIPPPPTRRRKVLSWVLLIGGAAAILFALFGGAPAGQALSMLGLGAIALFIAVALLSPRLVPLIAGAVGYPLERLRGVAGRLARENAMRNPSRTAVTAAALMIGLALVTFVSILAAGVKSSIDDTVENRMKAQLVVLNKDGQFTPISDESAPAIRRVPGVDVVSPLSSSQAKIEGVGGKPFGSGVDPPSLDRIWTIEVKEGPPNLVSTLTPRDIALETDFADANSLDVGDTLNVTTPIGRELRLRVTGIFEDKSGLIGDFMVPRTVIAQQFGQRDDDLQFIGVQPGANVEAVQNRVERVLEARFPVAEVQNRSEFKDTVTGGIDQFLALIYALLSLSVIVSLFGIVNTLVLSIHERTRELGMMRAIGTSRRLVRRIVRYESVITALIGAALGLVLGFILGVVTTIALEDEGFLLSIPVASLIVFAILAVIAGVVAAIPPARRASRLNVLEALAYE